MRLASDSDNMKKVSLEAELRKWNNKLNRLKGIQEDNQYDSKSIVNEKSKNRVTTRG